MDNKLRIFKKSWIVQLTHTNLKTLRKVSKIVRRHPTVWWWHLEDYCTNEGNCLIWPQSSQNTLVCTAGLLEVSVTSRDSKWNLHCWGSDCFAGPSFNIVSFFWRSAGLAVRNSGEVWCLSLVVRTGTEWMLDRHLMAGWTLAGDIFIFFILFFTIVIIVIIILINTIIIIICSISLAVAAIESHQKVYINRYKYTGLEGTLQKIALVIIGGTTGFVRGCFTNSVVINYLSNLVN